MLLDQPFLKVYELWASCGKFVIGRQKVLTNLWQIHQNVVASSLEKAPFCHSNAPHPEGIDFPL
jgi:hypothetical protein